MQASSVQNNHCVHKSPTMNDITPTRRIVNQVNDQKTWDRVQEGTVASSLIGRFCGGELMGLFAGWPGRLAGRLADGLAGRLVGVWGGLVVGRLG